MDQRCHNILWWNVALFKFQFLTTVIAWPMLLPSSLMLLTTGLYILYVQPSWVFMDFITHAQNNWGKSLPSFHKISTFYLTLQFLSVSCLVCPFIHPNILFFTTLSWHSYWIYTTQHSVPENIVDRIVVY